MCAKIKYHLCVVGLGGTGSVFTEKLTRYLSCRNNTDLSEILLIDGDLVEEKNLRNQSFVKEDIGLYKSAVWENLLNAYVKGNYCKSYGTFLENGKALENSFSKKGYYSDLTDIILLIGACDNHACRLVMEEFFETSVRFQNILYFDSANEFDCGETVFSAKIDGKIISPVRSEIFPDVLKGDLRPVRELSCEELNAVAPQHMLINQLAAMQLMMGVVKVLEKREIPTGVTYYNTSFQTQHFPTIRTPNKNTGKKVG